MKKYKKVSPNVAAEIKVMYQVHKIRGAALLRHFPDISKPNVYKHARRPIGSTYTDGRKHGALVFQACEIPGKNREKACVKKPVKTGKTGKKQGSKKTGFPCANFRLFTGKPVLLI